MVNTDLDSLKGVTLAEIEARIEWLRHQLVGAKTKEDALTADVGKLQDCQRLLKEVLQSGSSDPTEQFFGLSEVLGSCSAELSRELSKATRERGILAERENLLESYLRITEGDN